MDYLWVTPPKIIFRPIQVTSEARLYKEPERNKLCKSNNASNSQNQFMEMWVSFWQFVHQLLFSEKIALFLEYSSLGSLNWLLPEWSRSSNSWSCVSSEPPLPATVPWKWPSTVATWESQPSALIATSALPRDLFHSQNPVDSLLFLSAQFLRPSVVIQL